MKLSVTEAVPKETDNTLSPWEKKNPSLSEDEDEASLCQMNYFYRQKRCGCGKKMTQSIAFITYCVTQKLLVSYSDQVAF